MYALIVNPTAGRGKASQLYQEVEKQLKDKNIPFKALLSDSAEVSSRFVRELALESALSGLAVIGGDGTTASILNLAYTYKIPLAILPAGSGNDAARTFQLTTDPILFANLLVKPKTQEVDLIEVNGKYCMTVAAAGVDAAIGVRANQSSAKRSLNKIGLGSFVYPVSAIHILRKFLPFQANLTVDDVSWEWAQVWLIACGNTATYGGGLRICPDADPQDGQMSITIAHSAQRLSVIGKLFPKLLLGKRINSPYVTYLTGKDICISFNRKISLLVDGDPVYSDKYIIHLIKNGIRLIDTKE